MKTLKASFEAKYSCRIKRHTGENMGKISADKAAPNFRKKVEQIREDW